jgi:hypothetical protein
MVKTIIVIDNIDIDKDRIFLESLITLIRKNKIDLNSIHIAVRDKEVKI